jgi:hypothetical protein
MDFELIGPIREIQPIAIGRGIRELARLRRRYGRGRWRKLKGIARVHLVDGNGRAVNMPRQDLLVPGPLESSYHALKNSCASLPEAGITTMRLTSDILTWPTH